MISITFQVQDFEDFKKQVNIFLKGDDSKIQIDLDEVVPQPKPEEKPKAKAKKKKSKTEVMPPSKDEVVTALQELNGSKGIEEAKELLAQFACKRVGDLAEDRYADFIKACNSLSKS